MLILTLILPPKMCVKAVRLLLAFGEDMEQANIEGITPHQARVFSPYM